MWDMRNLRAYTAVMPADYEIYGNNCCGAPFMWEGTCALMCVVFAINYLTRKVMKALP